MTTVLTGAVVLYAAWAAVTSFFDAVDLPPMPLIALILAVPIAVIGQRHPWRAGVLLMAVAAIPLVVILVRYFTESEQEGLGLGVRAWLVEAFDAVVVVPRRVPSGGRGHEPQAGNVATVLLLAIDTSTTAITVALHDGAGVVAEETTLDARAHAEHLAPEIERALRSVAARPADVTDVVVGIGPGPFTGLRVGIVTGRTFAFALGLPVRGLTSLDALAHAAWLDGRRGDLLVATDARRKEVYAAHYLLDDTAATRVAGPVVDKAVSLPEDWRAMPVVGRGPLLYPDDFTARSARLRDVPAGALADLAVRRLAAGAEFDGLEPLYLRRPDVAPAAATKSTLG